MKRSAVLLVLGIVLVGTAPATGAETATYLLDASSPRPLDTGLVAEGMDYFLVLAQGSARVVSGFPVTEGWFDPSGLGRLRRVGQVFDDMPYGSLVGTFGNSLDSGFYVGDDASWWTQAVDIGESLKLGFNMSAADQAALAGGFVVHVTRFFLSEVETVTLLVDADSPRPVGTGVTCDGAGESFVVVAHGVQDLFAGDPPLRGWFDPSGLGRLRRTGQVFDDMPFGSLIGTFGNTLASGFYLGDLATWDAAGLDVGHELKVGLNLDADDQANLNGFFSVHVIKFDHLVTVTAADRVDTPTPAAATIENSPNPFNPRTTIRIALAAPRRVSIAVTTITGAHVATLDEGEYPAGAHVLEWNGRDDHGRAMPSGPYLVRMDSDEGMVTGKMMLVR